ncbi:MAG: hypothetical protein QOC69_1238 [Mycobacterium sp.]|jgi:hypothetical protein|nr:hypothetical protein [Mycobacterium sp.]
MIEPINFHRVRGSVKGLSAVIGAGVVVAMGAVTVGYPGNEVGASATIPKGWPAATVTRTPPAAAPQTSFAPRQSPQSHVQKG